MRTSTTESATVREIRRSRQIDLVVGIWARICFTRRLIVVRRDNSPDFIEAIARGLDVIRAFGPGQPVMSLAGVAAASDLPRPTARRILHTLEQLGYVRQVGGQPGAGQAGSGDTGVRGGFPGGHGQ